MDVLAIISLYFGIENVKNSPESLVTRTIPQQQKDKEHVIAPGNMPAAKDSTYREHSIKNVKLVKLPCQNCNLF